MKNFLIILFIMTFISVDIKAQRKVKSKSFNTVLNIMLNHDVKEITVSEAQKNSAILLDAREKNEYDVSHIKNAVYVGYDNFNISKLYSIPKNKEIIIYCSIGKRSEKITEKLIKAGYTNVCNLYGGIFEWVNEGNSVVDLHNRNTNKVHAYGRFWSQFLDKGEKVYN